MLCAVFHFIAENIFNRKEVGTACQWRKVAQYRISSYSQMTLRHFCRFRLRSILPLKKHYAMYLTTQAA